MSGVVWCHPAGSKLGNSSMAWLHAYAYAQSIGAEFVSSPWIGEQVFDLPKYGRPTKSMDAFPVRSEIDLALGETNVRLTAYAQSEKATRLYSKADALAWLRPLDLYCDTAGAYYWQDAEIVAHLRRGDFVGYGYPLVSKQSYHDFSAAMNSDRPNLDTRITFVSEENPGGFPDGVAIPDGLSFVPDFWRLVLARVLLRANSSFSWVAGLLNQGLVFSPEITPAMEGGKEHRCNWRQGNWPRLSNLAGCGDLRLKNET
jgi:hypothetical protein